jgi:peroxiredoxin
MKFYQLFALCLLAFSTLSPIANAAKQGDVSPDCTLNALDNSKRYDLKQFAGKVLYVDFWASWCAPCAKSFPFLNELHKKYQSRGLEVLAINLDEQPADAHAFLSAHPAEFAIASDLLAQCAENFGVEAMPSSYIIDRKGVIAHVHLGFKEQEAKEIDAVLEQLLAPSDK